MSNQTLEVKPMPLKIDYMIRPVSIFQGSPHDGKHSSLGSITVNELKAATSEKESSPSIRDSQISLGHRL